MHVRLVAAAHGTLRTRTNDDALGSKYSTCRRSHYIPHTSPLDTLLMADGASDWNLHERTQEEICNFKNILTIDSSFYDNFSDVRVN